MVLTTNPRKYALFQLTTLKTKDIYMLPYFKYTEDIQNFCMLTGFTIDVTVALNTNVCMYDLEIGLTPYITSFNLEVTKHPLIPSEKVFEYLTLMLNGYPCEEAVNELNVVG